MEHLTSAVLASLSHQNWYAALSLSLTLPDICGRIQSPQMRSRQRYVAWFDRWLLSRYQALIGPENLPHTFLSGRDCYALRCAFLHQGELVLDGQPAREVLDRIHFTAPRPGSFVHRNQTDAILQLQVDAFCIDICRSVADWLREAQADPELSARIRSLAMIH
jgi:hypothetical protein